MADTTNAVAANGTRLEYSLDGTTYTKIAHLVTVTPPLEAADEIEVTDHDSQGRKQFIKGMVDAGSMPFKVNVADITNIEELLELASSGKLAKWRIIVPTAPEFMVECDGFVKAFNMDELVSGAAVTMTGEIRVSGKAKFGFKQA